MSTFSNSDDMAAGHPALDPVVIDILLEKLSSDDDFRALFHANPNNALASLGVAAALDLINHIPAPGDVHYCLTTAQLASKEEIAAAREALRQHLAVTTNHTVIFCFEADKIASVLERS